MKKKILEVLTFISTAMIGDKFYKSYWLCYFWKYV